MVVDEPASIGALAVAARHLGIDVAYLPGLAMRRIADLHPGNVKTDARDAYIIAEAARSMPHALRRVDTGDEALAGIEVIVGYDDDLAGQPDLLRPQTSPGRESQRCAGLLGQTMQRRTPRRAQALHLLRNPTNTRCRLTRVIGTPEAAAAGARWRQVLLTFGPAPRTDRQRQGLQPPLARDTGTLVRDRVDLPLHRQCH